MINAYDFLRRMIGVKYDSNADSRILYYRSKAFPSLKKIDQLNLDEYHALYSTREVDGHELVMDKDMMKRYNVNSVSLRRDGLGKRGLIIDLGGIR